MDFDAYAAHLVRLGLSTAAVATYAADIYLAFACAQGNARAIEIFEKVFLARTSEYIVRFRRDRDFEEEVGQLVREKLLIQPEAKIATYAATGPLIAWTRMVVVRVALDLTRSDDRWRTLETRLAADVLSGDDTPELRLLRERYLPTVEKALRSALHDLSARDQGLLRIYFVDGFSIDRIAAVHKVHRGTAARWIVAIRNRVLDEVRRAVGLNTGLTPPEVDSIWRLLRDDIHLSLSKVLAGKEVGGSNVHYHGQIPGHKD
ncbi:MAG TPA: hypothetical protein VNO55_31220 [Polyangia bacterium]|nr:hypothetical protein [Polyangia bacterium]